VTWTIPARYAARLLALVLGWALGILGATGASFTALVRPGALLALAVLLGGWFYHVVQTYADTGTLPAEPLAASPAVAATLTLTPRLDPQAIAAEIVRQTGALIEQCARQHAALEPPAPPSPPTG